MRNRLLKIGAAITAIVAFLNLLTGTWVNLVNLHVLPSVYAGRLNGSVIVALGLSGIIALLIAVSAFFFGGFYFFVALVTVIVNWVNPSAKLSPSRLMWDGLVEVLFHWQDRRNAISSSQEEIDMVAIVKKMRLKQGVKPLTVPLAKSDTK